MTYTVASNGVIHRDGCEHANRVRILNDGWPTVEKAREVAREDFSKVRVAPCAKQPVHYHFDHLDVAVPGDDCEECRPMPDPIRTMTPREIAALPEIPADLTPEEIAADAAVDDEATRTHAGPDAVSDEDRLTALYAEGRSLSARIAALAPAAIEARKAYERGVRWGQQPKTLDRKRADAEAAEVSLFEVQARKVAVDAELDEIHRRRYAARTAESEAVIAALLPLVPASAAARADAGPDHPGIRLQRADGRFGPEVDVYGPRPDYDWHAGGLTVKGYKPARINHSSSPSSNRPDDAAWMVEALTAALAIAKAWDAARGVTEEA